MPPPERAAGVFASFAAAPEEATIMSQATAIEERGTRLHALTQSGCFVCGQDNPHGLRIPYERQDSGEMTAAWTPDPAWEGFRGIVHGGVVSTVLDEAMSKAVAATGSEALTAELRVRFRRAVPSGATFLIRGWIVKRNKRLIETEAMLTASDGTEHAHAWATFLALPKESG
jgi:acyl-coenzyme A thioesterase PaaI-like protein